MVMRGMVLAALGALAACGAAEGTRYNWDGIGQTYCEAAIRGDVRTLLPLMTPPLQAQIAGAQAQGQVPPRLLLQAFDAPAQNCSVRTRNAGVVEVRRETPGQAGWTDLLVVVPEPDGTTRIDDILFATRASDTLRERLRLLGAR